MAENLNYNINVTSNASQSLGSLKKELIEAQNEVITLTEKFGETSEQVIEAAKRAADLKDRISDAKELTDTFNPDAKFRALSLTLSSVAGGFTAIQGAIGLFGGESKNLEKQLLKVQSALALSQGLSSLEGIGKSFAKLNAVIQSTTIFQKANAAANTLTATTLKAVGLSAEATALSFKVLKTAIVSTGIGVLVIALGELVSALMNYTSATDEAKKKQEELNKSIAEGTKAGLKAAKDFVKTQSELDTLRLQSEGATEDKITAVRVKAIKDQIKLNEDKYEELLKTDKKAASELADENAALQDELTKIQLQGQIKRNEQSKQQSEKNKAQREKEAQEEFTRNREREARESAAQQVQIEAFRSTLTDRQRDLLSAEDEFEKKKGDLIRAGVTDFTLVQEQYRLKLLEINKKYDEQDAQIEEEKQDKKREIDLVNKERQLQTQELNAINLEDQKKAELDALQSEYQIKYDLAVKNGEDLLILKDLLKAKEKDIEQKYADEEAKILDVRKQKQYELYGAIGNGVGALSNLFEQGTAASKTAALSEIAINTALGYLQGLDIAQKGAKATGPAAPFAFPIFYASQIAAIIGAVSKAKSVLSTVKGGGASFPSGGSLSTNAPITPRIPQTATTNISAESINAIGNQAIRAYVVETDITSNQKRIQAIKQRARFS